MSDRRLSRACRIGGTVLGLTLSWVAGPAVGQQLDDTWTVMVNGQTVQVEPGGGFSITNIASADLFGPGGPGTPPDFQSDDFLRVVAFRATEGMTEWAYSEPFQISQGETFLIGDLTFSDTPPPFPLDLRIEADPALIEVGSTTQLAVFGILLDGSEIDVTMNVPPPTAPTIYRTSNGAIASVDANGLVTGNSAGTAFITAVNEGATAVKRIDVTAAIVTTDVQGFAQLEDGTAVVGAEVMTSFGGMSTTDADGFFMLDDLEVPSEAITISVTVSTEIEGEPFTGSSGPVSIVPDGVTDAGIIVLEPLIAEFETDIGDNLLQSDDDFDLVPISFVFPFFGVDYNQVYVGSNGYITFTAGDGDFTESISKHLGPLPRISVFYDDLHPGNAPAETNTYVNEFTDPNRLVVTWFQVPEFPNSGSNTLQGILFENGRIQFGYAGLTAIDSIVGLSPGGSPQFVAVNYSALISPFSLEAGVAVLEQFTSGNPFDLDGGFVLFDVNAAGGYDVRFIPPTPAFNLGQVFGSVVDGQGRPCVDVELRVVSSWDPSFVRTGVTDAAGQYIINGIPFGLGVRVEVPGLPGLSGASIAPSNLTQVRIDVGPAAAEEKMVDY